MSRNIIRTGLIAGLVAAVGVTAAIAVSASAGTGGGSGSSSDTTNPRGRNGQIMASLTDEQRQCLTDAGITKPQGKRTAEERAALRAAAETCGITLPAPKVGGGNGLLASLTDEQRQCLTDAGITKPQGKRTAEERAALRAAAETCGITLPAPKGNGQGLLASLTDEQRQCLTDAGITKPQGKRTAEERAALRAAAETCGITLPAPKG